MALAFEGIDALNCGVSSISEMKQEQADVSAPEPSYSAFLNNIVGLSGASVFDQVDGFGADRKDAAGNTKINKKRTWKKPEGKPKRPLSAYNLFFKQERERIVSTVYKDELKNVVVDAIPPGRGRKHRKPPGAKKGKIGFANLARSIAAKWKTLDDSKKVDFEAGAQVEKERYWRELEVWKNAQEAKNMDTMELAESEECTSSTQEESGSEMGSMGTVISQDGVPVFADMCNSLANKTEAQQRDHILEILSEASRVSSPVPSSQEPSEANNESVSFDMEPLQHVSRPPFVFNELRTKSFLSSSRDMSLGSLFGKAPNSWSTLLEPTPLPPGTSAVKINGSGHNYKFLPRLVSDSE